MQVEKQPLIPHGAAFFQTSNREARTRHFAFLLCPSFTLLAFASALEPLRIANQLSQRPLYDWTTRSADGAPVISSCGVSVGVDGPQADLDRDVILMVCAGNRPEAAGARAVVSAVTRHFRHGGRIGGLCTGPIALARAGLLKGRRFTLHWENQPAFRENFPDLDPSENKFEIDDRVLTCGGGAAATDMMLEVIAQEHGEAFAAMVSDMCLRRVSVGRDLPQRSPISAVAQTRNPGLAAIVELMKRHREDPLSMDELAERVGYSRRHVERLFLSTLGQPPARFYLNLRLDHARNLLASTDLSLAEVAAACGFSSTSHFSKSFVRRFGTPPSRVHCRL
ncbi:GlxA family transcriptional regulator [Aliigemmobacter aestuarii]|uniref:GlxA family transcriptional regulator n=1 Tax=Aliigemmobacter aestuarii TaxID=1445661 RepID=A0A4S3MK53_9RHOB|nr:GlxA family transcriptional regulator [Gemmobacter aestuarii]THD82336.1 GlxA family transcriptional regulator [Gemmobacter aestuarii]